MFRTILYKSKFNISVAINGKLRTHKKYVFKNEKLSEHDILLKCFISSKYCLFQMLLKNYKQDNLKREENRKNGFHFTDWPLNTCHQGND